MEILKRQCHEIAKTLEALPLFKGIFMSNYKAPGSVRILNADTKHYSEVQTMANIIHTSRL